MCIYVFKEIVRYMPSLRTCLQLAQGSGDVFQLLFSHASGKGELVDVPSCDEALYFSRYFFCMPSNNNNNNNGRYSVQCDGILRPSTSFR